MQPRIAVALSGGGAKGDFEVGALRYLYGRGIRPSIVTGSSVGAINALKLAEGDSESGNAQQKLEHFWRQLHNERDMYDLEPWVRTIQDLRIQKLFTSGVGGHAATAIASWLRLPALLISGLISSGVSIDAISDAIEKAAAAQSVFNLAPVERLLRTPGVVDLAAIRSSGIALRLSVVGLESGQLRHVDEYGHVSGTSDVAVDLIHAALASASIPVMFPPRLLAGEHYIDGGVREILPLLPALQAGATQIYAITATQPTLPMDSFAGESLVGIGVRAIGDLMVDELTEGDIRSALVGPQAGNITTIRPTLDVHDIMTIDRGLIDIAMDYGYMRAGDHVGMDERGRAVAVQNSDRITRLRLECWRLEEVFARSEGRALKTSGDRTNLSAIRDMKRALVNAVQERMVLGAPLPANVERWWLDWELHSRALSPTRPWDRMFTTFGPLPMERPPVLNC